MIVRLLSISSILVCFSIATEVVNNSSLRENPTVPHNIPAQTNDVNKSRWNISDWEKQFTNGTEDVTGNTMMFMNHSPFLKRGATTTDTAELTTEAYNDDTINGSDAAIGYTESYRATVMSKTLSNTSYAPHGDEDSGLLKCYIARDLPFRYRCEESGLVYGGSTLAASDTSGNITNMDGMSGKQALNLCKEQCKREIPCQTIATESETTIVLSNSNFNFQSANSYTAEYSGLDVTKKTKNIKFDLKVGGVDSTNKPIENSKIYFDISYLDQNSKEILLVKHFWHKQLRTNERVEIGKNLSKLKIKVYSQEINATISGTISSISLEYESKSKYICAALQDISSSNSETFGLKCPNGTINTFTPYKICSNSIVAGDNTDGTYSNQEECNNKCNIVKQCKLEVGSFDADIFETFREGRLGRVSAEGDFTSSDENSITQDTDCTNARIGRQRVINETAFDAHSQGYQTVLNETAIPNVDRPRISNNDNLDYEETKKEEWKDSAYQNMLDARTYASTVGDIGGDTNSSFAYSFNLTSGASYGEASAIASRELIWRLKPNASYYNNNKTYKLYAVLKVDIEKYAYNQSSNARIRDQIWYVKTSTTDTFKPFIRAVDYATLAVQANSDGDSIPVLSTNDYSEFLSKTFSSSSWIDLASSSIAPSFNSVAFLPNDFFYEFKVLNDVGRMIYSLPGLVKSSYEDSSGSVHESYGGNFMGTGDGVAGYAIYTFFSENSLSYQDLTDKINAIDNSTSNKKQVDNYGAKIYQTVNEKYYENFIKGDNIETNANVEIYQYGPAGTNSLKIRIKPRKEDVGKIGFIYIFAY